MTPRAIKKYQKFAFLASGCSSIASHGGGAPGADGSNIGGGGAIVGGGGVNSGGVVNL